LAQDIFIQGRNITTGKLDLIRDLMAQNPLSTPPTEAQKKRGRRKKSKARKNAVGAMDALTRLFQGKPFVPKFDSSQQQAWRNHSTVRITPILHHSNTPSLQYSITPITIANPKSHKAPIMNASFFVPKIAIAATSPI
jgi:hypothetical protein